VATWAEAETVLAADLGDGTDDPHATAPNRLRRALASLPPAPPTRTSWPGTAGAAARP
jgi:hypothetical protein